jgi:hypothetical protein
MMKKPEVENLMLLSLELTKPTASCTPSCKMLVSPRLEINSQNPSLESDGSPGFLQKKALFCAF